MIPSSYFSLPIGVELLSFMIMPNRKIACTSLFKFKILTSNDKTQNFYEH